MRVSLRIYSMRETKDLPNSLILPVYTEYSSEITNGTNAFVLN